MNNAKVSIIFHANEKDKNNATLTIHVISNHNLSVFLTVNFQSNEIIRVSDIPTFCKVARLFV